MSWGGILKEEGGHLRVSQQLTLETFYFSHHLEKKTKLFFFELKGNKKLLF